MDDFFARAESQNRARLVRTLYERRDRLEAAPFSGACNRSPRRDKVWAGCHAYSRKSTAQADALREIGDSRPHRRRRGERFRGSQRIRVIRFVALVKGPDTNNEHSCQRVPPACCTHDNPMIRPSVPRTEGPGSGAQG
ncbi:hypothetical protein GCM10017674_66530 [Streptomyces gardneri]|uniref:Uncharacterized protein n=1 Tax=Streptomyces gardneri TaxID=66892 RepID=A0A4Y3RI91_9ACTN|nr:hypothetical protein SGA01_27090 [Streptomyces gardneri]GHH16524.1 hypothetical protein GCM10017674_66530 [Streptomyces gardneri]